MAGGSFWTWWDDGKTGGCTFKHSTYLHMVLCEQAADAAMPSVLLVGLARVTE